MAPVDPRKLTIDVDEHPGLRRAGKVIRGNDLVADGGQRRGLGIAEEVPVSVPARLAADGEGRTTHRACHRPSSHKLPPRKICILRARLHWPHPGVNSAGSKAGSSPGYRAVRPRSSILGVAHRSSLCHESQLQPGKGCPEQQKGNRLSELPFCLLFSKPPTGLRGKLARASACPWAPVSGCPAWAADCRVRRIPESG